MAQTGRGGQPGRAAPVFAPEAVATGARIPAWVWLALAVLLAVAALGWWRASVRDDLPEPKGPPEIPEVTRFEQFVASAARAKRISLDRLPDAPAGVEVEVFFDEAKQRAAVRVKGDAPAGRVFELWTLRDDNPHSEGLIPASGIAFIENTGARGRLGGFAVSLEPPQGAKDRVTPTKVALIKQL